MNDLDLTERLASEIVLSDFGPRLVVVNSLPSNINCCRRC